MEIKRVGRRGPVKHLVQEMMLRQYCDHANKDNLMMNNIFERSCNMYHKDVMAHYGCVNAIEFSPDGQYLASGGDDRRLLLWTIQSILDNKPRNVVMKGEHSSNIFCIAFDNNQKNLFSAGNDEQVLIHDIETQVTKDVFLHTNTIYGISVHPTHDSIFASASDDGKILIWDSRQPSSHDALCVAKHKAAFYSVQFNPVEPSIIAGANNKSGIAIWDVRMPTKSCIIRYGGSNFAQSAMSVRFNTNGTRIVALRRRQPPCMFDVKCANILHQFDSPGYYNSCTMKSCCFAGNNDQYVLSGSDDFKLYIWKVPRQAEIVNVETPHMVLKGHRSIVNQVRFHPSNFLLASSGVEKVVKLWSLFPGPDSKGSLNKQLHVTDSRKFYSPEDYINLVLNSGVFMTHDYSHHSVHEDARMMAFFDSLVQRDIEGWTSDSSPFSSDSSSTSNNSSSTDNQNSRSHCTQSTSKKNSTAADSSKEESMEISDILSRRIAAKKTDMKYLSTKKKRLKRSVGSHRKRQKRCVARIMSSSSSSSSDDENYPSISSPNDVTINAILGPPVWEMLSSADGVLQRTKIKRSVSSNPYPDSDSSNSGLIDKQSGARTDDERPGTSNEAGPSGLNSNVRCVEFKKTRNEVKKASRKCKRRPQSQDIQTHSESD